MDQPPVLDDPDDVVVDVADLHVLPNGRLDVLNHLYPSHGVHQASHLAILDAVHPSHSSNSVNVVSRIQREIIVYHMAKSTE